MRTCGGPRCRARRSTTHSGRAQVHTAAAAHDANVATTMNAVDSASRTRGFAAMKFTAFAVGARSCCS